MESHLRVELRPRIGVADEQTQASRAETVRRLTELGQIDAEQGTVNSEQTLGWIARIGDREFPVSDFAVQVDESGTPMLSLILAPDSLSIGEPTGTNRPPSDAAPKISMWGDDSIPDPRESIPGWQPEGIGEQVANRAMHVALRTWEPSGGREKASAFKRLVRLGGEGGNAAVTA